MGKSGLIGQCTEIFVSDVEICNVVLLDHFIDSASTISRSKANNLFDLGIGLERLAMVQQNLHSVFETNYLRPLKDLTHRFLSPVLSMNKISAKELHKLENFLTDKIRSILMCFCDGIMPGNKKNMYLNWGIMGDHLSIAFKKHLYIKQQEKYSIY